jgi:hypothetical protein
MTNLDELSRLLEQATPGPWETKATGDAQSIVVADSQYVCSTLHGNDEANAALIVALRNAAEDLIRDARRLAYLESLFTPMGLDANGNHPLVCRGNPARLRGPNLRAAVDAAIAQEQP